MHVTPKPSQSLQCYHVLQGRQQFSQKEKSMYYTLRQGYEGERIFANIVHHHLKHQVIALYDLLFEDKGTVYQIAAILISSDRIFLVEVKHFQGEFQFQNNRFFDCQSEKEYRNPFHQLQRCSFLFQALLSKLQISLPVQTHLVFNHPQFTLFQAERNPELILPTQIPTFINKIKQIPGRLQSFHHQLAAALVKQNIKFSPYENLPNYQYQKLRKGIFCNYCRKPLILLHRTFSCPHCACRESIDSGILRNTLEFHHLFPEKKIKTGVIQDWCNHIVSRKTITRVFQTYLTCHSKGAGVHYTFEVIPS